MTDVAVPVTPEDTNNTPDLVTLPDGVVLSQEDAEYVEADAESMAVKRHDPDF